MSVDDPTQVTPVGLPSDLDIQTRVLDRIKSLPDGASGALVIHIDKINGAKIGVATKLFDDWKVEVGASLPNYNKLSSLDWHIEIVKTW